MQNLNDWDSRGRVQYVVHVAEAETQRDEHGQAQQTVEQGRPHHGRWKNTGGVLELFGHVCSRIRSEEAPERGGDPDQAGKSHVAPSPSIRKLRKYLTGWGTVAHDP